MLPRGFSSHAKPLDGLPEGVKQFYFAMAVGMMSGVLGHLSLDGAKVMEE